MLRITLTDEALRVVRKLRNSPEVILETVRQVMDEENEYTVGHIQQKKLSKRGPDTLGVVTNRLRASIRPAVAVIKGSKVVSAIGSNVKYAAAHEFGTDPYVIEPKNKKALHFALNGREIFARRVRHPGHKTRAPIRKGTVERIGEYSEALSTALVEVYRA